MHDEINGTAFFGHTTRIGRRELLKSVAGLAGSLAMMQLILTQNAFASPASSAQGAQTDVDTETVSYPSDVFKIQAYIAKPSGEGKHPGIILIHDNRGLNDDLKALAKRFAAAGFVTMAPNLASRVADTSNMLTAEASNAALSQISPSSSVDDLRAGFTFLSQYPGVDATKISSVGFGWGGWRSFMLATEVPSLYRSVVFCGNTPISGLENIHAPVLAHYAQYDFRTTGNAIYTEKELKELGKKFTYYVYPGVTNAFFSTDAGPRYNAAAADLAWTRTLDFLKSSAS
jgi:carboxymethylenebutenolidase